MMNTLKPIRLTKLILMALMPAVDSRTTDERGLDIASRDKLRTNLLHKERLFSPELTPQSHRRVSSGGNWDEVQGGVGTLSVPKRVRIAPFDLLLAPTPVQLQRGDEDLLLQELQELVGLYVKAEFGAAGTNVDKMGTETKLQYILFSDIEQNAWTKGNASPSSDKTRSILRFNGGIASFSGPDPPSQDDVNAWVEAAVNDLFVAALGDTRYEYVELTQYFPVNDPSSIVQPEDIILSHGLPEEETTESPQIINQAAQDTSSQQSNSGTNIGRHDIPLTTLLASILAGFVVIIILLAFWIHHNNKVVRVLCLSSKDNEEIIEFGNHSPVSIKHETGNFRSSSTNKNVENEKKDNDNDLVQRRTNEEMKRDISLAAQCAVDEASLQEESLTSASEWTFPTISAASMGSAGKLNGLSFRNPNPFVNKQESFQKERKTHLTKDMMFSKWTGKAPNLDSMYGKRHDESVLKPSYFSAAREWEYMSNGNASGVGHSDDDTDPSEDDGSDTQERPSFRVEQAHENGDSVGLHLAPSRTSRPKKSKRSTKFMV